MVTVSPVSLSINLVNLSHLGTAGAAQLFSFLTFKHLHLKHPNHTTLSIMSTNTRADSAPSRNILFIRVTQRCRGHVTHGVDGLVFADLAFLHHQHQLDAVVISHRHLAGVQVAWQHPAHVTSAYVC